MKDYLEILLCKLMIYLLKRGYGEHCDGSEWLYCPGCKAAKTIEFLEDHIKLIQQ